MMKKRILVTAMAAGLAATAGAGSALAKDAGERVWIGFHEGQQVSLQRTLQRVGAQVHHQFDRQDAVVATLSRDALTRLKASGSVRYIRPDQRRYPMAETVPYGIDQVGARDVWDADRNGEIDVGAPTGDGVTVCVIDSGLAAGHSDFANVDVIGGYPEGWDNDRCGHGSHVAGSIAANLDGSGVVGVSPGAVSLYILKVFGNSTDASCLWSYSSDLVDAAYRCQDAGANVINMSLGGDFPDPAEDTAFADLLSQGVLSVAAAGNDGNTAMSYPASYDSVVSVGGVDIAKAHYTSSQVNAQVEIAAAGVGVLSTVGYTASEFQAAGTTYMSSAMGETVEEVVSGDLVDGGLCLTPLTGVDGQVVLCERGEIGFVDKGLNAQAGGAVGVVIYNNAPGNFSGTFGDPGHGVVIPGVSLSQEDGQAVVAEALGQSAMVSTEFTYPANGFDTYSGTSMATPHVAGAAAVLWSDDLTLSATDVRNALSAGAEDLGDPGRDYMFGNGLLNLPDALTVARSGDIPPMPEPPAPPPAPDSTELANGELVTLDPVAADGWARYYIDVWPGATNLTVELRELDGSTGDGDLYVRYDEVPSLSDYDCRPYELGSIEDCAEAAPQAGRHYVWVHAFPFDGELANVTLQASFEGGTDPDAPVELSNAVPVEIDSIEADGWRYFYIDLPAGNVDPSFDLAPLAGEMGDADLYLNVGDVPTLEDNICESAASGNVEFCRAVPGTSFPADRYYVGVYAWPGAGDVANVELTASYDMLPPPASLAVSKSGARMRPTHDLTWTDGADEVDVWLNGSIVHTGANTGEFSMSVSVVRGSSTWQVCNAGTESCTVEVEM